MFIICKADFSINADNNDLSEDNNDSKVFLVFICKHLNYPTTNVKFVIYSFITNVCTQYTFSYSITTPASSASESDAKHSSDNNPDLVQLANNFSILVRAIIGVASLVALGMFIYFIRAMYYLHNQLRETEDSPSFKIKIFMLFCNQMNGADVDI